MLAVGDERAGRFRKGVVIIWYSGMNSKSSRAGEVDPVEDFDGLASPILVGDAVSERRRLCRGAREMGKGESGSKDSLSF